MSYDAFEKQPGEHYDVAISFADRLGSSETVSTCSVSAYALTWSMGRIYSSTAATGIAIGSTASSQSVNLTVSGGTDTYSYRISVTANSTSGNTVSEDLLMWVKEK